MAIRGRRYPPKSLVHGIIMANPVPRIFIRWNRPYNRVPIRQTHLQNNVVIQSNTPGSPIASSYKWHRNILPARFNSHTAVIRSMAGVQPNAITFAFKQHRPAINVQSTAHRVTIIRAAISPSASPIAQTIYHRAQIVSRPSVSRSRPVTLVNPPVPQVNRQLYDMNRLARQRTSMVMMTTPNRR